jgi:hypothetical protein
MKEGEADKGGRKGKEAREEGKKDRQGSKRKQAKQAMKQEKRGKRASKHLDVLVRVRDGQVLDVEVGAILLGLPVPTAGLAVVP